MARAKKSSTFKIDFTGIGKAFEADNEYVVVVDSCEVKEGQNGQYLNFTLLGTGEFEGARQWYRASFAPGAMWRTRAVLEALGVEVEGEVEINPSEFVGRHLLAEMVEGKDQDGNRRLEVATVSAVDGADIPGDSGEDEDEIEVDLDEFSVADLRKLGAALDIKTKKTAEIKELISEMDPDEVMDGMREAGLAVPGDDDEDDDAGDDEGEDFDIDQFDLEDDEIKSIAKAAGIKGRVVSKLTAALAELGEDDFRAAAKKAKVDLETDEDGDDDGDDDEVTEETINEMSAEELDEFVEENDLDVDLDKIKTIRKKRAAVVEAARDEELID